MDMNILEQLNEDIYNCYCCDISYSCTQKVMADYDLDNYKGIMSIAEAPGKDEDRIGKPFVGDAGQVWMDILSICNLTREDIYTTNTIHCRPTNNSLAKDMHEVKNCQPLLFREVEIVEPKVILLWGKTAVNSLFNFRYEKMQMKSLIPGIVYYDGIPCIVNYHPSFMMQYPNKYDPWAVIRNVEKVWDYV